MEGATLRAQAAFADGCSVALACDPSLEGSLGAVGISYLAHADPERVRVVRREACQPRFGEVVVDVPSDADDELVALARRVYVSIERHAAPGCPHVRGGICPRNCAGACARKLSYASASDEPGMPEAIHRYVRFAYREGPRLRSLLTAAEVVIIDELARSVLNECEHTRQFVRFSLLVDGSLLAIFRPKADTLPLTSGYFAERMRGERFCIVDPTHLRAMLHDSGKLGGRRGYLVMRVDEELAESLAGRHELSPDEPYVRALWKQFYDSVALPGRDASQRGYDLRASWMPKRFWSGLTELAPSGGTDAPPPERYAGA